MTFYKDIKKLYEKKSYSEKYGGSIFITTFILAIFIFITFRSYFYGKIRSLKKDWSNKKCNPFYMPFAGYVSPHKGSSKLETASQNFNMCTKDLLTELIAAALAPANYAAEMIVQTLKYLANTINRIRDLLKTIRNRLMKVNKEIMNRILNMLIPVLSLISTIKTAFHKVSAVLAAGLYTAMGMVMAIKAALGVFLTLLIIALIIFAASIIIFWIMPWTWWIAIPMTAFFLLLAIPTGIMVYWVDYITGQTATNAVPPNPCFDKNTVIQTKNGKKCIKHIQVNDELLDGSVVTAIIKSSIKGAEMYKLHNIQVTGQHYVYHETKGWIMIKNHPDSKKVFMYNEPHVFCLNTSSKKIKIGEDIFLDWDDINDKDLIALQKEKNLDAEDIHTFLDGGFSGNTKIKMMDGTFSRIDNIKIDDLLKYGTRVLGIVEIDGKNIHNIKKYTINGTTIVGGPNLQIIDKYLGNVSTLDMDGENIEKVSKLYHLITDTKTMIIGTIHFRDYNGAMEILYGENIDNILSLV